MKGRRECDIIETLPIATPLPQGVCNSVVGSFPRAHVVDTKGMSDEQIKVWAGCDHHSSIPITTSSHRH